MIPSQLVAGLFVAVTLLSAGEPHAQGGGRKKGKGYEPAVKLPDDFVRLARVPEGGLGPRVEASGDGHVLLYFKGSETQGDLFLAHSKDEARTFEPSVRINPEPGSVLTQEVGDSGSLDVGPDGRAHVVWVSGGEQPTLHYVCERGPVGGAGAAAPAPDGTPAAKPGSVEEPGGGLSPVQDLGSPPRLAAATAIALDPQGKIYVFFVAEDVPVEGETPGLRVWMRTSGDGVSFTAPIAIDSKADGVSDSSSFAAHVDRIRDTVFVFYVTTGRKYAPEVRLLASDDGGGTFTSKKIELLPRRDVPPRAKLHLSQEVPTERTVGGARTILSWDCYARVLWGGVDPTTHKLQGNIPIEPRLDGPPSRRFRAQGASNGTEYLLAWLEHPVGDRSVPPVLRWQVWYSDGLIPLGFGNVPADPVAAAPAVFPNKGRGFTVLY